MKEELERIMNRLNIIYDGLNPMITIYGDGSWSIEIDGAYRGMTCRIESEVIGNTIEELEDFLNQPKLP